MRTRANEFRYNDLDHVIASGHCSLYDFPTTINVYIPSYSSTLRFVLHSYLTDQHEAVTNFVGRAALLERLSYLPVSLGIHHGCKKAA
jgi:hypothetical protein